MALVIRSFDDIYRQIYQDVLNNTPITNMNPGSTARAIVDAVASRFAELYDSMDAYNKAAYLSTATGPYLDYLGELYGVTRYQSTRAYSGSNNFKFYIDPISGQTITSLKSLVLKDTGINMDNIIIVQGTTVSQPGDSGISYSTTEAAILSDGGVYTPIIAESSGKSYGVSANTLVKHNIATNQWELYSIANYILCTNDSAIQTGWDYESDANYRQRIMDARSGWQAGNIIAIRNAAMSVPGVVDVIINQHSQGVGTFDLIIISAYPIMDDHILAAVNEAVSSVVAAGTKFNINTSEYLAIELKLKLYYQPSANAEVQNTISRNVRKAVIDYTNNLGVGGEWIVNEVIQRVMDVSDLIKDTECLRFRVRKYMRSRSVLSNGKIQTEAAAESIPYLGEIGATMIWGNQKCKMSNPAQMFLMLPEDLVIC